MRSASNPASATARSGSPFETSGMMAAAIIGPSAESGPSTRIREGPNRAYATSTITVVYRPVTGGSPASSAYAMPWGTRSAVSASPAPPSPRNPDRWYVLATAIPGTHADTGPAVGCPRPARGGPSGRFEGSRPAVGDDG